MTKQNTNITEYYTKAKLFVQQNSPSDARASVLAFVDLAREIYNSQTGIMAKANTKAFIIKWVKIAAILRESGITGEVLEAFSLSNEYVLKRATSTQKYNSIDSDNSQGWGADMFERYQRSVVGIRADFSSGVSGGTGFIVSANGYLLTNEHVVCDENTGKGCSGLTMSFVGDKAKYKLEFVAANAELDVALCRFDPDVVPEFIPVPRIKKYSRTKQGADVVLIGNPFLMGLSPLTGTVTYVHDGNGNLVHNVLTNKGDSGGALFNRVGECIGINKSSTQTVSIGGGKPIQANGMSNATPMDAVDKLLSEWSKEYGITL